MQQRVGRAMEDKVALTPPTETPLLSPWPIPFAALEECDSHAARSSNSSGARNLDLGVCVTYLHFFKIEVKFT